ncbi:unnamed protein product [Clonostachys rosea f. rosea IK726]|jgi:acetyl esterase/lipase|uniref:Uncharacterized protein n=1 Tax=Clonostachys rosea f. rosea IK726 TaxID=1349383 RepID=A0ACA9UGZ5_BIOOC|nr:unnamed protein product [Clonostachys rosea f. rosea IK726]
MDASNALAAESGSSSALTQIEKAARGREITGFDIFRPTTDTMAADRVQTLMSIMNAEQPTGGEDLKYGPGDAHQLRYWKGKPPGAPIVVFIHGGSWRVGSYLDSIGSTKVVHLLEKGYALATINYTLFPHVTVAEQVQEVANSLGYLTRNAARLEFDHSRIVLMGHSSGAHTVTLLGTDTSYLDRAGVAIHNIRAVISLDGSNYNAMAEVLDSPGPVAENMKTGLGEDPDVLRAMSPTYNARAPNANAFLLLHAERQGDIRQAEELKAVLNAAGTSVNLHVFEGESFEGHMQILLRLGDEEYPATEVLDKWLQIHVPVSV